VTVHPVARAAAAHDDVSDGLQAKFSLPYLTAFTILHGAPRTADFDAVDAEARALALAVEVQLDSGLEELESRVRAGDAEATVVWPLGSPRKPMDERALQRKVEELAGDRLNGVLDDPARSAADVLAAAGLS
jgi:2-methylcitrate dehydratase PrpD